MHTKTLSMMKSSTVGFQVTESLHTKNKQKTSDVIQKNKIYGLYMNFQASESLYTK